MIRGRVIHGGAAVPDTLVLAADTAAGEVVADAYTDRDGAFEVDVDGSLVLLARCTAPIAGAPAVRVEDAGERVTLTIDAPVWPLQVRIVGDGTPDELVLVAVPVSLAGVPDDWLAFAWMPIGGAVYDGWLEQLVGAEATVQVQEGRWAIAAEMRVAFGANAPGLEPPSSWVTVAASVGGVGLEPGDQGFEVDIRGPTTVELRVARGG